MKEKKEGARSMEIMVHCDGCLMMFPKLELKRCARCERAQYCCNKYMKGRWPVHKERCEEVHKHFGNEITIICDLCADKTCTETLSGHLMVTNKNSSNTRLY